MNTKIYEKIKKYIIDNHNFLLFLIFFTLVLNIKVPYVIKRPGGIISLNDRVKIDGKNSNNNFYTTYVSVSEGRVVTFLASLIMPNWDLEKLSSFSSDEDLSYKEISTIQKMSMDNSNNTAIKLAYEKLDIPYDEVSKGLFVYYSDPKYKNDFLSGDQILKCDNKEVNTVDELSSCVNADLNPTIIVKRNDKNKIIKPKLYKQDGKKIIGIIVYNDLLIKSEKDVVINDKKNEQGSSGGLMTTLAVYDALSNSKLSSGKKIAGTGTIDEKGHVGEIDGIKYKLLGADKEKVDIFFVPKFNYLDAKNIKKKYNLKLKLVMVETLDDAINYLQGN